MKKRFLCSALLLSMILGSASASFTDISNTSVQQSAAVLNALGIMQGVSNTSFNPNGQLTRAQFCKLAVTALGVSDVSAYENYTIFPDVPTTHWASGYINAALKHTDIKEKQIIRGFADGTFGPDKAISYAEVCTMLLRMLDYTISDVGPFWPTDYIAKAEALKLNNGVAHYGSNDIVKRGDAALLMLNTIQADTKKGTKLIMNNVASSSVEDSILLATSETDSDLRNEQALFYEGGTLQTRALASALDRSLIGARGTVFFDKVSTTKVRTFLPQNADSEDIVIKQSYADRIKTATDEFKIPSKTPVVRNGELLEYNVAWPDLAPDSQIRIFYDAGHQIDLLSAVTPTASGNVFVYGTPTAAAIPSAYKILKNGVSVDASKLKQYDIVSLNPDSKTAIVSDKRVTGYLQNATPSYARPSSVQLMGTTYPITDSVATYFTNMKYNDRITLLFDNYGNVAAAYPVSTISSDNIGIFSASGTSGATIQLLTGGKATGTLNNAKDTSLLGQLVRINDTKDGKLTLSSYSGSKASGAWTVSTRTLGTSKVVPNVKVYEMVTSTAPAYAISESDITKDSIATTDIRFTVLDSAGSITAIVLGDVTGQGWLYGYATVTETQESSGSLGGDSATNTVYNVRFNTYENGAAVTKEYTTSIQPNNISNKPIAIARGIDQLQGSVLSIPSKNLSAIGSSVGLSAFDSTIGVKLSAGYYTLPENIGVYAPSYGKMISLREAKLNFTQFTMYGDTNSNTNKTIYMITAQ